MTLHLAKDELAVAAADSGLPRQEVVIDAHGLSREYRVKRRSVGFSGSLKSLVNPNYSTLLALNDASFQINQGELVGLLGANGAGKTTLVKLLSGLLHPSAGSAVVTGSVPWKRDRAFLKKISFLTGQRRLLTWELPGIDSFELLRAIYELPQSMYQRSLDDLVDLLAVKDVLDRPVRTLSLGQRMKLELIGALLHRPEIIFLDEPTLGLDYEARQAVWRFVRIYRDKFHATVLLTSHYIEDIEAMADRVLVLDKGNLVFDGGYEDLKRDAIREKVIQISFAEGSTQVQLPDIGTVTRRGRGEAEFLIPRDMIVDSIAQLIKTMQITDLSVRDQPVEQAVARLLRLGKRH